MTSPRTAWRVMWQPPARAADTHARERSVGFLELFYDLVFVVLVAQLAHSLAAHPTWPNAGWFLFLFYVVWSLWLNGTFYADSHSTHDVSIRVFTLAQMIALALMAAFVAHLPEAGSAGFALAYGVNCLILAVMWFRTGFHDPDHRAASYPYSLAYGVSGVLLVGSAAVEGTAFWSLLAVAVVLQTAATLRIARRVDRARRTDIATPSIVERFGLLVILVLGEVIAGAVNGMAHAEVITAQMAALGAGGVLLAGSLWWVYFDSLSERRHLGGRATAWLYGHFPLVAAIAAAGAGVLALIEHAGEELEPGVRWLVVLPVSAALLVIAALTYTVTMDTALRQRSRWLRWASVLVALAIAALGFAELGPVALLAAVLALLLIPVLGTVAVWLRLVAAGEA